MMLFFRPLIFVMFLQVNASSVLCQTWLLEAFPFFFEFFFVDLPRFFPMRSFVATPFVCLSKHPMGLLDIVFQLFPLCLFLTPIATFSPILLIGDSTKFPCPVCTPFLWGTLTHARVLFSGRLSPALEGDVSLLFHSLSLEVFSNSHYLR